MRQYGLHSSPISFCHLKLAYTDKCVGDLRQVRRHFRPELLNRLDEIVVFDPLSHDQLRKVGRLQMKDVASRLADRGVALAVTDAALDFVLAESYDPVSTLDNHSSASSGWPWRPGILKMESSPLFQVYGARPIRRWLERKVVTELSRMLIRDEIDESSTVCIDAASTGNDLVYRVERNGGFVNAATGQKTDVLIQLPNGPRGGAAQAVKKMRIEEIDDDEEMYE